MISWVGFQGNEQPRRWWPRSFVVRHALRKVRRRAVLENAHLVVAAAVKDRVQAPGTSLQAIEKTVRASHSRGGAIFAGFDGVKADERAGVEPPATVLGPGRARRTPEFGAWSVPFSLSGLSSPLFSHSQAAAVRWRARGVKLGEAVDHTARGRKMVYERVLSEDLVAHRNNPNGLVDGRNPRRPSPLKPQIGRQ